MGLEACEFAVNVVACEAILKFSRFQWVACQLNELQKCFNADAVRKTLASLPRTLDETYERMLLKIPDAHIGDARRVFQFMVYSARALRVEEVCEIFAFDPDRNPPLDIERRLFDTKQLLSILSNLVTFWTPHQYQFYRYRDLRNTEIASFSLLNPGVSCLRSNIEKSSCKV
jgi:hypothetical protein